MRTGVNTCLSDPMSSTSTRTLLESFETDQAIGAFFSALLRGHLMSSGHGTPYDTRDSSTMLTLYHYEKDLVSGACMWGFAANIVTIILYITTALD